MLAISITDVVGFLVKNQGSKANTAMEMKRISESVYRLSYLNREIIPIAKQTVQVNPVDQEPAPPPFVIWAVNTTAVVNVHNNHEKAWGLILYFTVPWI